MSYLPPLPLLLLAAHPQLLKRYPSVGVAYTTKPVGSRQLAKRIAARPCVAATSTATASATLRHMQHLSSRRHKVAASLPPQPELLLLLLLLLPMKCQIQIQILEHVLAHIIPWANASINSVGAAFSIFHFIAFSIPKHFFYFCPRATTTTTTNKCPICAVTGTLEARF